MRRLASLVMLGGLASLLATAAAAQNRPAVIVTPGSAKTFRAAITPFAGVGSKQDREFVRALGDGLLFSNVFQLIPPEAFLAPKREPLGDVPPNCSEWRQINADALIEGRLRIEGNQRVAEAEMWDIARCKRILRKRYRTPITSDPSRVARRLADDTLEAFTGIKGVSSTELAFVSTRTGNREIFVMDAIGANARQATANGSINNFPNWSPDGADILYTSYRKENRPLLFSSSRRPGGAGALLSKINGKNPQYRGVFSPSGKEIALVMSPNGSSEIFVSSPDGGRLKRLTRNHIIDVSPAWSPDGKRIAFVSDRTGAPQVYVMDADGRNIRRLTFQGTYNTNPAWSPDGQWIAYESRLESQFDIWLIDLGGAVNVPLLNHHRSDEGPTWAPNSRKLAFSSTRRGKSDIYVVDVSGDSLKRVTQDAGNNTSPAWGPFPQ
jgi:TolB protein